jgi:pSer/pThr/pTyr-binding forkhead associated (FHA) protein
MATPEEPPPDSSDRHWSLRFLSGRCKGSEYVLGDRDEVVIGRAVDADIVLGEGIVSRHHARFSLLDGVLSVEDISSTNGTFVNGDRVRRRRLEQGDRVLVGTSILKVVWSDAPLGTVPPRPTRTAGTGDGVTTTADQKLSGRLDDIGVPELLEMLCSTELAGVLVLQQGDAEGRITVRAGQVEHVEVSTLPKAPFDKCLQRLLGWTDGSFSIRPYRVPQGERLDLSIRQLLVDALFKLDELGILRSKLPGPQDEVVLPQPLLAPLGALSEAELELLQIAHNHHRIDRIFDQTPETDWAAAQRLLRLLDAGYLRRA